ncbi:FAD-dependent oxidoreductase [Corynebacterium mastitidis]
MPVNTSESTSALNALRRERELDALIAGEDAVDVVIIGGGITGVGLALDVITRGLSTVLVEKHDLAFGTSRWSSKLAHGGLRYLAKMELGIAHHSAVERGIIMERTAPPPGAGFAAVHGPGSGFYPAAKGRHPGGIPGGRRTAHHRRNLSGHAASLALCL